MLTALVFLVFMWNKVRSTPSVLISSPFDNFRIECPHYSGAQRLSIRMIESQGMIRQDSVFALSCNHIDELYPWPTLAQEVGDVEREDCRYSNLFDPILETQLNFTCANREYIAGIARLSDTRIQVECCRMRTRVESQCIEQRFAKPVGTGGRVDIEHNAKLINALAIEDNVIIVRFCDLSQRPIGEIRADFVSTTPSPPTRLPIVQSSSLASFSPVLTQLFEEPEQEIQSPKEPKKIIKISRISSLSEKAKWDTKTSSTAQITSSSIRPEESTETVTTEPTATTEPIATTDPIATTEPIAILTISSSPSTDSVTSSTTTTSQPSIEPKQDELKEVIVGKQKTAERTEIRHHSPSSIEVTAAEKTQEKTFPSDKDYENVEEARVELMESLAGMMQARKDARKIITRVKASGLPQNQHTSVTSQKFAERMLKEIEGNGDPANADELLKQSMEVLADLGKVGQQTDSSEENTQERQSAEKMKKVTGWSFTNSTTTTTDFPTSTTLNSETPAQTAEISTSQSEAISTESTTLSSQLTISTKEENQQEQAQESGKDEEAELEDISVEKPAGDVKFEPRPSTTSSYPSTQLNTTIEHSSQKPAIQLAPFEAFPTPPPADVSRAPPRLLAQIAHTIYKHRPSPNLQIVNTPSPESTPKLTKLEKGEEYDEGEETTTTTAVWSTSKRSRTKFPSTTRIPLYKRRFLSVEVSTGEPATTRRAFKLRATAKGQALSRSNNSPVASPQVDEETNDSPFDVSRKHNIFEIAGDKSEGVTQTLSEGDTNLPSDVLGGIGRTDGRSRFEKIDEPRFAKQSPFDVSAEIRRAPRPHISDVSTGNEAKAKIYERPVAKSNVDMLFSAVDEDHHEASESGEYHDQAKDTPLMPISSKDGARNFEPIGNQPVKMPAIIVYDTLDLKNLPPLVRKAEKEAGKHRSLNEMVNNLVPMKEQDHFVNPAEEPLAPTTTQIPLFVTEEQTFSSTIASTTTITTTETPSSQAQETETEDPYWTMRTTQPTTATAAPYNLSKFYYMPKARRPVKEKETAVRDQNKLIIACGGDNDVWLPSRCPPHTDCFIASDSTYRICCPVASH